MYIYDCKLVKVKLLAVTLYKRYAQQTYGNKFKPLISKTSFWYVFALRATLLASSK